MRLLFFQYHYSSYTKLPFPPHHNHHPRTSLRGVRMGSTATSPSTHSLLPPTKYKEKLVVIMGATGCGKSKLSVDLATRFSSSTSSVEIVNSDKMQVYKGLDITTNKIPFPARKGVPHHLLGHFDPTQQPEPELSTSSYRLSASSTLSDISSRGNLPVLVGGSNSFIHALLVDRFDPDSDFFAEADERPDPSRIRYDCCFLWVDVKFPILCDYLIHRVDEMLGSGMFEELEQFYEGLKSTSGSGKMERGVGIMKAIGVPEFEEYFSKYPHEGNKREEYEKAVTEIKRNTCQLAKRQLGKIQRLRDVARWDLRRIDATSALQWKMAAGSGDSEYGRESRRKGERAKEVWEKEVVEPCVEIVRRFLESKGIDENFNSVPKRRLTCNVD